MIMEKKHISIVIPVCNEEENLPKLLERLERAMKDLGKTYEIIFIDDGSKDTSLDILKYFTKEHKNVRVLELSKNFGQHSAIMAGFEKAKGEIVVTLDADLQNPPEEIPNLVAKIEEGYEVVGGWRRDRDDSFLRKLPSKILNMFSSKFFGIKLKDYGCMLRAYRKEIVDQIVKCNETSTFIPALANSFAKNIIEIPVKHEARAEGKSKYSITKLLRLNFDLMTGFSLLPIQLVGISGMLVALAGLVFAVLLFVRRLIVGPEVEGVFTLFAILFIFVGLQLFALGVVGEYIGRIYQEVRNRPRFVIRNVFESKE
jgi:undecaprenyl-phosphate 4-deoxy-4-formamido-L-arabinose transferase